MENISPFLNSSDITLDPFAMLHSIWKHPNDLSNVFDSIKTSYGGDTRHLRQPFALEDKMGIKDYANLLFADSAVVNTLMGNAGITADHLIKTQYSAIASASTAPDKSAIDSIITKHFKRVVFRDSTDEEQANYYRLFKSAATDGGHTADMPRGATTSPRAMRSVPQASAAIACAPPSS